MGLLGRHRCVNQSLIIHLVLYVSTHPVGCLSGERGPTCPVAVCPLSCSESVRCSQRFLAPSLSPPPGCVDCTSEAEHPGLVCRDYYLPVACLLPFFLSSPIIQPPLLLSHAKLFTSSWASNTLPPPYFPQPSPISRKIPNLPSVLS